jgi:hypothetical protein
MGQGSEGIAASGGSENNGLGSGEAHHVSISSPEDRSVSASALGEVEGAAEEGCLEPAIMPEWVVPHYLGRGKAVASSK